MTIADRPTVFLRFPRFVKTALVMAVILGLQSCASSGAPPIQSREAPPSRRINVHEVQPGETLYSIAWRYEADFRDMARINGLSEPYALSLRQQLKIYDDGSSAPRVAAAPIAEAPFAERTSAVRTAPVTVGTTSTTTSTSSSPRPATTATSTTNIQVTTKPSATSAPSLPAQVGEWQWPVTGRVVTSFGADDLTKGIVLDPGSENLVSAAAEGVVVYAGTGMRGYGNLLIVKHSNLFLSAYAYNAELLAKEGDQIRAGQSIARVGANQDGAQRVYFEIRKDGKPVDPIRYLPKR